MLQLTDPSFVGLFHLASEEQVSLSSTDPFIFILRAFSRDLFEKATDMPGVLHCGSNWRGSGSDLWNETMTRSCRTRRPSPTWSTLCSEQVSSSSINMLESTTTNLCFSLFPCYTTLKQGKLYKGIENKIRDWLAVIPVTALATRRHRMEVVVTFAYH